MHIFSRLSELAHLFAEIRLRVRGGELSKAIRDLWSVATRDVNLLAPFS